METQLPTEHPLVSIIIPTYNHARFIQQAVETALHQTYPAVELLVVDDGSTDDTAAKLAPYQGRLTVHHQPNQGVAVARNLGTSMARGAYCLFLDADDWLHPETIAAQMAVFQKEPALGMVYVGWHYMDEAGQHSLGVSRPQQQGNLLEPLIWRQFHCVPGAALVQKAALQAVGGFDQACAAAADTDLWVRLAYAGYHFGYVDEPFLYYRQVSGSMSRQFLSQAQAEFTRLHKFFTQPDLPATMQAWQPDALAILSYELAARFYHLGEIATAQEHLRQALTQSPALAANAAWQADWLAGYALGPTVSDAAAYLTTVLNNLPPEATTLARHRRRVRGQLHIAAAFRAHQQQQYRHIRPHLWPALWWYPKVLLNRGFWRIMYQALAQ